MTNHLLRIALCVLAITACRKEHSEHEFAPTSITPPPQTAASGVAPAPVAPARAPEPGGISGTVVETMPASTYTYARLDHDGHEIWLAGPETKLAVGTKLGPLEGTLMQDFHSDTLNRTFPEIYFVSSFGDATAPATPTSAAPADSAGAIGGSVVATMDSGGYTYAQLEHAGVKTWVAGPPAKLVVGTKLANLSGTLMTAFHSSTLNRTFDQIYFIDAWGSWGVGKVGSAAPAASAANPR